MKPIDLLTALGDIGDTNIEESANYRKPKKYLRYFPAAACLIVCLILGAAYIRGNMGYTDGGCLAEEGSAGASSADPGEDIMGEPMQSGGYAGAPLAPESGAAEEGYCIVSIFADGEEMQYEPAPLYIATTADPDMDAYVSGEFARDMTGITLFTAGDEDPSGAPRWYAVTSSGVISELYWFSETENGYGRGWADGNDYENAFNYLASLTSYENPLYLVRSEEMLFAVIGDTAYYLPGSAFRPDSDYLPYISTDGMDLEVICIE